MAMEKKKIVDYYMKDWKIAKKGESLVNINHLIEAKEATNIEFELAFMICDQIKYLIIMSTVIPKAAKGYLQEDIMKIKKGFQETYEEYFNAQ